MRNKTMRRGLAWILSAATIMGSVPVSAEDIILDTEVVSEENEAVEEELVEDADVENVVEEDADIVSDSVEEEDTDADIVDRSVDEEEEAVIIDGTDEDGQESDEIFQAEEDTIMEDGTEAEENDALEVTHTYADKENNTTVEVTVAEAQEFPEGQVQIQASEEHTDEVDQALNSSYEEGYTYHIVDYVITDAEGNAVAFPEGTVYTVTDSVAADTAKVFTYEEGTLLEVKDTAEEEGTYSFQTDDLSEDYIWADDLTEKEVVLETESESETETEAATEVAEEESESEEETEAETEPQTAAEVVEIELKSEEIETETEAATDAAAEEISAEEDQIATFSEDDIWKSYMWSSETGTKIAMLEVASFNEEIADRLTDDCTLTVEEVSEGDSYDSMKALLNAKHDNSVEKFGYIRLILKDKDGNQINLEDADTLMKLTYIGEMGTVSNVPSYVYSVYASTLMAGGFDKDEEPSYAPGMGMSFITSMMVGSNEVAVVAKDDLVKTCPLNPGTYTITANLTVLGDNNDVLEGMQVYLGNPNFPPLTPLSYNAKLVVDENKKMTLTLENFSEVFQIVSMEDGTDVHIKDRFYTKSETDSAKEIVGKINNGIITPQFRHEERINGLVLTLDNANGLYEFGNCVQCPIILEEDHYMKMHLQVNFDEYEIGYDDAKGDTTEKTFTDDASGVSVTVRTTEQAYADKMENAKLEVKENKSGNYSQMIQDMYYNGTVQKKIYDISLKDKDGNEIDLSNTDNTETNLTIKTDYAENRLWKLDGLDVKKLRATSEKNLVTYTNLKTGLGTFAVVDNASAIQYAYARTKNGNAVGIYFYRQFTSGFGNVTEDTNLENAFGKVKILEKEISTGTAYKVAVEKPSTGEKVDSIGGGSTKLGLYVPYNSEKEYYLVYTNGEEQTAQKLDASNHNDEYVLLTVLPETSASDMNIINTGLYNAVTENTSSWQCYVLATERKLASTPSTLKEWNGTKKELTYSGVAQNCFTDGKNYQLTDGNLEYTNAGTYFITVVPEDGYCWVDGTNTAKTISNEIKKHKLAIRYKSEAVLTNGIPKYELEYGYTTSDTAYKTEEYEFVNDETVDTASGFKAPTIKEHATDIAGDYVLIPEGGEADNYELQLISGTLHVMDSQDKIVAIPKMYEDTTYTCARENNYLAGGNKIYIVPKDAETIATITGFEPVSEDAGYTLTGELSSNKLGTHRIQATLKEGYVWEDGTAYTKSYFFNVYQIIDKPEATEKVVYNGKQQCLFDEVTLNEIKAGVKWIFPSYISVSPLIYNDQYEETEVGDYEVQVSPKGNYCWDETGSTSSITYHWSIVPAQEKEVTSTEVITANLSLKGSDAATAGLTILETLAGADGHAYLTNPSAPTADSNEDNDPDWKQVPPTTAASSNATLVTYTDGTMAVKVPVKNAVFTLQKLGTSEQVAADDVVLTTRDGKYGANTSRIDSITIPVTEKTGSVVFKGCEVYPTLLMTGYTVPLTLTWGNEVTPEKTSISNATVSGIADAAYTGKAITQPNLKVTLGGGVVTLIEGTDYTISYSNNVNVGTATITITGIGNYKDTITKTFKITEAKKDDTQKPDDSKKDDTVVKTNQTITVKVGLQTYDYASLQKKAESFTIGATASGKITYKVTSTPKDAAKYITVDANGKVTLNKAPAGTYQITVSAAATSTKNAASSVVTVKVNKSAQNITVKAASKTLKTSVSANQTFAIGAAASGKLTYKVTSTPKNAAKYITVDANGKVTLKKNAPAGTYQVTVSAAATSNLNAASRVITVKANKGTQKITVKVASKTIKITTVAKKNQTFTIGAKGTGKITYKVTSTPKKAGKYISVNKSGKVTIKKKAPAGTYKITVSVAATSSVKAASRVVTVKVSKSSQKVTAKVSSKTVKTSQIAKKNQTFAIGAKGAGKLTYKVTSTPKKAGKYISVNKDGKVTIKKKAPKGTYQITVTAAGNATYAKATKTVTVKVK